MSWFLMNKKSDEKKKKEEIKKQFLRAVTKESDGKLSKDQWTKVLLDAKIHKSTDEVEKLFESKELDVDGRLSFEEFMGEQSRAERLFKLMDRDGDGFVTKNEFKEVCKNLKKEQIEATFRKFDQTGNDKLNLQEFRDMMNKRAETKTKLENTKKEEVKF
eukprot:TRINITY_DN26785_c0_g1_i1.p1 TRINITY_DN26785_c0_g1~~TRINITY_DN26785_c0_g1_i1.p1  ORF type:complete len:160 (-),score=64.64 TRINITY_DN26785_c0_g1_i1:162-641(-)